MTPAMAPRIPALGAGRHETVRWRFGKQAPVARTVGGKSRQLAVETHHGGAHQGLCRQMTGIVDEVACPEVVRAITHQIVVGKNAQRIEVVETFRVAADLDAGIDGGDGAARASVFHSPIRGVV